MASIERADQNGAIIPAEIRLKGNAITFVVEQLDVEYNAVVSGNEMAGTFNQLGRSMPNFTVTRAE